MKIKNKDCLEEDMDCINVKQYMNLQLILNTTVLCSEEGGEFFKIENQK